MAQYGLSDLVRDMRLATAGANEPAEILRRLTAPARRLALSSVSLEPRFRECDAAQGFAVHCLPEEPDHSLSVVVASLLPGRSLMPHNHKTWALQVGVDSEEVNVSWRRIDDGARPGYAEIEETGRQSIGPGDVVAFMPEDIHSVINESGRLALSLNLYGVSYAYAHSEKFDPVALTARPLLSA
jgi:predicted metal-dependent enzyme (double-stranded beta helix superfamily)